MGIYKIVRALAMSIWFVNKYEKMYPSFWGGWHTTGNDTNMWFTSTLLASAIYTETCIWVNYAIKPKFDPLLIKKMTIFLKSDKNWAYSYKNF